MSVAQTLDRLDLERWVVVYSDHQTRAPFVREAAAALRLSIDQVVEMVDRSPCLYRGHPGRTRPAQTIEMEEV